MQIPAADIPFIWTLRRHRLWHHGCRREYFYHYYGSRGGHEAGAGERFAELCHYCRNLLSADEYRRRVIYQLIRRDFFDHMPEEEEDSPAALAPAPPQNSLAASALAQLEREWEEMLLELPLRDHRKPMLLDLCSSSADCRGVKERLRASLLREIAVFECSIRPRMKDIPYERRRLLPSPLFIHVGELECCIRPLLAWTEKGHYFIVESAVPADSDEEELLSALHRHYVMNSFGYPPARIHSIVIDCCRGELREIGGSISRALRTLRHDAGGMLKELAPDAVADREKFPVSSELHKCSLCRFRAICSGG